MAAHHSYTEVSCPTCGNTRTTRKDLVAKASKESRDLLCRSCAIKACDTRWDAVRKAPEDCVKNQGAYKSFQKAQRRVKTNHHNAYATVEFRFESYAQFLEELGPRPEGMTLDRTDPTGHYEPGNVRWATIEQQAKNRNPRFTWTPKKTATRSAKIETK